MMQAQQYGGRTIWLSPQAAVQTALYAARSSGVVWDGAAGIAAASCGTRPRTHMIPSPGACVQKPRDLMNCMTC